MAVYALDPLSDSRWDELLQHNRRASVFHSRGWLSALREAYGYHPIAFSTSAADRPLENGLLCCEIRSWVTGRRLVSLPFSDHCDFLTESGDDQASLLAHVRQELARKSLGYIEVRPRFADPPPASANSCLRPSDAFLLHTLSLDPPLDALFRNLHKDCIQRKVRRAERERLAYETGRSDALLRQFYLLLLATRRRQGLPPQPLRWFRQLIYSMGDHLVIRVASKDGRPVAAIITLAFKTTLTYKYGCSDQRFHNLGGMPFLFWKTIQEAKDAGMHQLDLGRSEPGEIGLTTFKERLGAHRAALTYYRMSSRSSPQIVPSVLKCQILRRAISTMPDALLVAAGKLLYRHIG